MDQVKQLEIREIVFTGTTTDPQLYDHEEELITLIREKISDIKISVHTNGVLAIRKMKIFNLYDRACISFPSFDPDTYNKMMGSNHVPDIAAIVRRAKIPVKISCIINEHNVHELTEFAVRLQAIGVKRIVLRKLFGDSRNWEVLRDRYPVSYYRENPVYDVNGMEVTYWDFDLTKSRSINLFPNGTISSNYLLVKPFFETVQVDAK